MADFANVELRDGAYIKSLWVGDFRTNLKNLNFLKLGGLFEGYFRQKIVKIGQKF
jgi:hypothetical protein